MSERKPQPPGISATPVKLPYRDQLRRPEWLRRRADILELHHCTCKVCQKQTPHLSIHHRYYISGRMAWEYPDWALAPVCDSPCHAQIQEEDRIAFQRFEQHSDLFDWLMCPTEVFELAQIIDKALMRGAKVGELRDRLDEIVAEITP